MSPETTSRPTKAARPSFRITAPNGVTLSAVASLVAYGIQWPGTRAGSLHNQFRVSVTSSNGARTWFLFQDSAYNYERGIQELSGDAIGEAVGCFLSDATTGYEYGDVGEFARDFGYVADTADDDVRGLLRAARVLRACHAAVRKVEALGFCESEAYDLVNQLNGND